jgi:hypothetical protein
VTVLKSLALYLYTFTEDIPVENNSDIYTHTLLKEEILHIPTKANGYVVRNITICSTV